MNRIRQREVEILLVEDDDVDAESVIRGFRNAKIANTITVARDGVEAFKLLRGNGEAGLNRPNLVLLDLNMPRMNGIEFLQKLRQDDRYNDTVVFVLTTSAAEEDRIESYRQHIAGYMVKSDVGPSFKKAVTMLEHYWTTVVLPE